MSERHVRPGPGGGWTVSSTPGEYANQDEAVAVARGALDASDGGELIVFDREGKIVRMETVGTPDPRFLSYRRGRIARLFTR